MSEYGKLLDEIKSEFPKFEIIKKEDSFLMKVMDILLKIVTFWKMKLFMTQFVTTNGYKVYVPSNWPIIVDDLKVCVLRHERVHMRQIKRYTHFWFTLSYLFVLPTIFAYFRKKYEQEAYEETIRYMANLCGVEAVKGKDFRDDIIGHFTSAQYFWTWPFRKSIENWYDSFVVTLG